MDIKKILKKYETNIVISNSANYIIKSTFKSIINNNKIT